jgi:hypothetical protein
LVALARNDINEARFKLCFPIATALIHYADFDLVHRLGFIMKLKSHGLDLGLRP